MARGARQANYPHSFINLNYYGCRLATAAEINCKLILAGARIQPNERSEVHAQQPANEGRRSRTYTTRLDSSLSYYVLLLSRHIFRLLKLLLLLTLLKCRAISFIFT